MEREVLYELKTLQLEIMRKSFLHKERPKSTAQFKIMKYLGDNQKKEIFQKDLEEVTHTRKSTLSGILNTMEKNGTIRRIVSDTDARKNRIVLTEESIKRGREIKKYLKNANKEILKGISKKELEVFYGVIEKMKENVKTGKL